MSKNLEKSVKNIEKSSKTSKHLKKIPQKCGKTIKNFKNQ